MIVAGGAGDNAASAAGIGVTARATGALPLGTSGVYLSPLRRNSPNPARAVHAFCHAFPGTWHQMTVMLTAASALRWLRTLTHADSEAQLVAEAEALPPGAHVPLFLPYLLGRTHSAQQPARLGRVLRPLRMTMRCSTSHVPYSRAWHLAFLDGQQALLEGGAR